MAHRRKSLTRVLTATLATALVSVISALVLSPAASAQVTIVPGTVDGGGTETFAVRLANERSDVPTTRLELTFPTDIVIPSVEVAPVDGWTATVNMRPLDPPVTVGDRAIDEAAASIVWEGGEVGPNRFEQFLVTAGPLPPDGRLVFANVQGYADGTEDRWTDPAAPGAPGAPTIVLGPDAAAEAADPTLWVLLVGGVLVVAVVGYRFLARPDRTTKPEGIDARVETVPERTGRP
jgi:uncharacterized protein YcnI